MAGDELKTRTGALRIDPQHGIVRFDVLPGVSQRLEDARENIAATVAISRGKRYPLLVNLTGIKASTPEARAYYAGEDARASYRALALVGPSNTARVIANIFLALYGRRGTPMKAFASEAEAVAWLKELAGPDDQRPDE